MTNKITNINVKPLETGMAELHNDIRRCRKLTIMAGHYSVLLQTNTQPKIDQSITCFQDSITNYK